MPCYDSRTERDYKWEADITRQNEELKRALNRATRVACEALSLASLDYSEGIPFLSEEATRWWKNHQKEDRKHDKTRRSSAVRKAHARGKRKE